MSGMTSTAPAGSPLTAAPISNGLVGSTAVTINTYAPLGGGFDVAQTTSTSFVDVVNYTGSGVLEGVFSRVFGTTDTATLEILIDGVSVSLTSSFGSGSGAVYRFVFPVGVPTVMYEPTVAGNVVTGVTLTQIPFYTSLQIRHKKAVAGTGVDVTTNYRYRKTG